MKKLLAMMVVMSFLSVSCNKSDGSSDDPALTSTSANADTDSAAPNTDDSVDPEIDDPTTTTPDPDVTPEPVPDPDPIVDVEPTPDPVPAVPTLALTFQTNVDLINFDKTDAEKYNKAVAMVKKVVGTEKFKTSILNHTWNGSKQFANNGGKTNQQIYQSILDAAEKLQPAKNNTMDVGVKLYYSNNNVVGYTNTSITYINVNTKYFDTYAINSVASNLFHEWLHKLGYGHDAAVTAQRPYSVPYAVGYMVRNIGKSFL